MPKLSRSDLSEAAEGLKPFLFYGMELRDTGAEGVGECPFCGKLKFYANADSGLWDCKVCGAKGNPVEFLRQLLDAAVHTTSEDQYASLLLDRGLLNPDTLYSWGIACSPLTGEWLVPGYFKDGKVGQLYRWATMPAKIKGGSPTRRLLACPGLHHQLMGLGQWNQQKPNVYVCEGPWDGMALMEVMSYSKPSSSESGGSGYAYTGNLTASVLAAANVIAAPGANAWHEGWSSLFAGKRVHFLYDNDHPIKNPQTGAMQAPAAWAGMKRACEMLASAEEPPLTLHVIHWGNHPGDKTDQTTAASTRQAMGGYCHNYSPGMDVRDVVAVLEQDPVTRATALGELLGYVKLIPDDWVKGRSKGTKAKGGVEIAPLACSKWSTLQTSWRKAMKWTPGLDRALSFMLACVASTDVPGEQLWGKVVGPPSCGKSTLCEALSVCKKHVTAKSTIRGFHSGYKTDKEGEEDNSLLATLRSKTLVTKDGDTLLQSPNLSQILAEARDIYDRVSRTHYRNKTSRDYEQLNMTWLLCGTSSLRALDQSELGQRFLDCVIMDDINPELERDVNRRALNQLRSTMAGLSTMNGSSATFEDEAMLQAKRLTGGYIEYLRANINEMLGRMEVSEEAMDCFETFGTFVAMMRARPSTKQDEEVSREMSTRLVKQFGKLGYCMAGVLGRSAVDDEVINRLKAISRDTARGKTMNIARALQETPVGCEIKGLSIVVNETEDKVKTLLRFLKNIGVVESFRAEGVPGFRGGLRWRLAPRMAALWKLVMEG